MRIVDAPAHIHAVSVSIDAHPASDPNATPARGRTRLTTVAEFILLMSLAFAAGVVAAGFFLPELPR